MRKITFGIAALIAVIATLGLSSGSANAFTAPDGHPTYFQNADMAVYLTDLPTYYHEYDLTFTPVGVDGVIIFSGIGKQFDNGGETITGSIDTTNHTVTWVSQYLLMDGSIEVGNTWGVTTAPYTVGANGDLDWTGVSDHRQAGYNLTGVLRNVPAVTVAPVAGNHGECVSGAVKAGFKGQNLIAISKDVTKVGLFGSATCKF